MRIKGSSQLSDVSSQLGTAKDEGLLEKVGTLVAESTPQGFAALTTGNSELRTKPQRGIAMALAGNGRWAWLDPKLGAMHAVAEAARKVACTGATPVAATNCLNFGNPEKPEIMAQLSAAIDGIAEACTALGTPVTGGNVSLYNETKGEGIYPTPVIGIVGLLDDVSKAVPSGFQNVGDDVLLLFSLPEEFLNESAAGLPRRMGSTEFAKQAFGEIWGELCPLPLEGEAKLNLLLATLASQRLIHSAADISDGGLPVCLARCGFANNIGCEIVSDETASPIMLAYSFIEDSAVVVSCESSNTTRLLSLAKEAGLGRQVLGKTVQDRLVMSAAGLPYISASLDELRAAYSGQLESQLAAEVVTA